MCFVTTYVFARIYSKKLYLNNEMFIYLCDPLKNIYLFSRMKIVD